VLNEAKYIRESLDTLFKQNYQPLEVVVIDGGSTDGTLDILKEYNVNLVVEPGLGQMAAINMVWGQTNAEYVTWWAGDDRYCSGAISALVNTLDRHPEAGFVFGWGNLIDAEGKYLGCLRPRRLDLRDLMFGIPFLPQSTLIRRKALLRSGMMDEERRMAADQDLYLRLLQYYPACCAPVTIAERRQHGESEDAKHLEELGESAVDLMGKFFARADLDAKQRTLQPVGMSGACLVAAWCCASADNRRAAFEYLSEAMSWDRMSPLLTPVGRRLLLRLFLPGGARNGLRQIRAVFGKWCK
jgi:hypothetical protein